MGIATTSYNGGLTREQFLFHEMRTTARLMNEGLDDAEIVDRIFEENLFQFPTERMIRNLARVCVRRLRGLEDMNLVRAIAEEGADTSRQICLYAMMRDSRLLSDFMVTVIGEKYRTRDFSFGPIDLNAFFTRLQEQDDHVATWSDSTIKKLKTVIKNVLKENEYIDTPSSTILNSVLIEPRLEEAIRGNNETELLPAFNCFA